MSKKIIVLGALLVLGGGAAVAASQALPGDMLYSFKLNVNEKVGGMLTVGKEAQAYRNIMLAERRLSEAAKAGAHGEASGEAYASIVADFNTRMKNISDAITAMNESGATDQTKKLATEVTRVLTAQSQALLAAQAAATSRGDISTGQSLDFILTNVTRALTAAAVIATGQTTLE